MRSSADQNPRGRYKEQDKVFVRCEEIHFFLLKFELSNIFTMRFFKKQGSQSNCFPASPFKEMLIGPGRDNGMVHTRIRQLICSMNQRFEGITC